MSSRCAPGYSCAQSNNDVVLIDSLLLSNLKQTLSRVTQTGMALKLFVFLSHGQPASNSYRRIFRVIISTVVLIMALLL